MSWVIGLLAKGCRNKMWNRLLAKGCQKAEWVEENGCEKWLKRKVGKTSWLRWWVKWLGARLKKTKGLAELVEENCEKEVLVGEMVAG